MLLRLCFKNLADSFNNEQRSSKVAVINPFHNNQPSLLSSQDAIRRKRITKMRLPNQSVDEFL